MALRKHGEGEVLPEGDQQRLAAQRGLTAEAAAAIQQEGEEADDVPRG